MKKVVIGILLTFIIIIALFFTWYNKNLNELRDIKKFNSEFECFIDKEVNGVDLTTVVNKAIENNNQYEIKKNSDGTYQNDGKNSIEIIIKPTKDGKYFPMEAFEKVGMRDFTKSFGGAIFKSTKIEYHNNGKISKIQFDIQT